MKLCGILGGTFDPVHIGHLHLARTAIQTLGLDILRCIPAGNPPHRRVPEASPKDRLEMVRLAFAREERCLIDDSEVLQTTPSWTIGTLERLWTNAPDTSHILIVGADALWGLPTWRRWDALLDYAHIAVANRPGTPLDLPAMPDVLRDFWAAHYTENISGLRSRRAGCLVSFTIAPCEVSATRVRSALAMGETIGGLVTPAVEKYIQQHHLYTQTTD